MTPTAALISYAIATACERLAHKLGDHAAEARVSPPPAHNLPPPAPRQTGRRRAFRRTA